MVGQGMADRLTQETMQKTSWTEQKEQKKRHRRRVVIGFSGLTALILLFAYMFVWQRVYTLQLAEEYSHRKQNVRLLKEKCQALKFEVEYLSSLENIEAIARESLAMMPLREAQFAKAIVPPTMKNQADTNLTAVASPPEPLPKATVKKKSSSANKPRIDTKTRKPTVKKSIAKNKGAGKTGA